MSATDVQVLVALGAEAHLLEFYRQQIQNKLTSETEALLPQIWLAARMIFVLARENETVKDPDGVLGRFFSNQLFQLDALRNLHTIGAQAYHQELVQYCERIDGMSTRRRRLPASGLAID